MMKTVLPEAWPESWIEHDKKMKPYVWSHRLLGWTGQGVGIFFIGSILFGAWGREFEAEVATYTNSELLRWLIFFGVIAAMWKLITFPLSFASYRVERNFNLSRQGVGSWLLDQGKGLILGAILGAIVICLIFFSVDHFPNYWWVVCATLLILFSILLAQLAPILLIPLFFKLKPMEEGSLKQRLLALCERFNVEVKDVFHLGLGEKTEKGNAAFLGLGRTKRIVIGDTLYEKFPAEQVEAVFAHELGHQVHNDLWKGIGLNTIMLYVAFGLAQLVVIHWWPQYYPRPTSPFTFLVFGVVLTIVQIPMGVVQSMHSRSKEWAADGFAAVRIGQAAPLGDALEKLTFQNFGQFKPNALIEFWSYSHPAPWRRIMALRKKVLKGN